MMAVADNLGITPVLVTALLKHHNDIDINIRDVCFGLSEWTSEP